MTILAPAFSSSSSLPRSARIALYAASLQLLLRELSVWARRSSEHGPAAAAGLLWLTTQCVLRASIIISGCSSSSVVNSYILQQQQQQM